jgi:putative FmdB family regulatory protein
MPMFEYKCLECDNKFEELVKHSDTAVNCPHCKSVDVKKLVSAFSSSSNSGGSGNSPGCGKSGFG